LSWNPVLDWSPMTKSNVEGHLADIDAAADGGAYSNKKMEELLDELVTAGQDWADDTFVDILRGYYGAHVRKVALQTVENGFNESGSVYSFTRFCVHHKKLELLQAVADLGLPPERADTEAFHGGATTPNGRWLDMLANVGTGAQTSFARQVFAFSHSESGPVLADILVKHDAAHLDIEVLKGSHGYAVIIDAMMRGRIAESSATEAAPARSRHRSAAL
tara:strand:- start:175 stop:831 length:657 start_codon:yes stop_codon:yes gene_type:complete